MAEVIVIGAGLSGVAAVIALRRAGIDDVMVLEKSPVVGGTWRDNSYPGCGCDVPAMLYEYSFAPSAWSSCFAGRSDILDYLRTTAVTHGVDKVVRHGVDVLGARWDAATHRWHLRTSEGAFTARAVIVATGLWHRPRHPDIPGLDTFPGPVFHSARWNHEADLTGRIAVVGTGASAVQFVPELQPVAAHIDVFQSTPHWVLPRPDYALPPWLHRHPAVRRAFRGQHYWTQEAIGALLRHPRLLPPLEAMARLHLRTSVPDPALRRALTPRYRIGGRRLCASDAYYPALTRPNVRLHPTRVTAVEGREVVGANGTRVSADAVILATGFHIGDQLPLAQHLHGADGTSLARTWTHDRRAYLGTSVSGYPNLFLLTGPNLFSGTTAVPTVVEAQLHYIMSALTHLRASGHTALDVRPDVQEAHCTALQTALRTTAYNTAGCSSYYFGLPGVNTFCWPWSTTRLVKRLHAFAPKAYTWSTAPARSTTDQFPS
ncbi:NAD(P)/FAD-dependent oxidoreductase [Streptomyces sp. NPDC020096]